MQYVFFGVKGLEGFKKGKSRESAIMYRGKGKAAILGTAAVTLGLALTPAFGSATSLLHMRTDNPVSLSKLGTIGSFTPTTGDTRLAAAYAKIAANGGGKSFHFTPTSGSLSGQRSITVMVRADADETIGSERASQPVNLAPVAFSLNNSRGWRKFALPEAAGRKELDPVPAESLNEAAKNFTLSKPSRFSTNVQLDAKRDTGTAPQTLAGQENYSVDVASSYSLSRNLNVTAGVRYRGASNRLGPITDERQDSQAVYLGTIFKF